MFKKTDCVASDGVEEEDTRKGQCESSPKSPTTTVTELLSLTGTEETDEV